MQKVKVDLDSISVAHLTKLHLGGSCEEKLEERTIAWITTLPCLANLGLTGWGSWDDLSPLEQMPIKHLVSDAGPRLLLDMFAAGCLQTLRSATLHARDRSLGGEGTIARVSNWW